MAGLLLAALIGVGACQRGGGGASGPAFADLRGRLESARIQLHAAVEQNSLERVPALDRALGAELDAIESRGSSLDLMQRESLALQIASARRCLTAIDRYVASGDIELVSAQLQQLDPTLREVDTILERAVRVEAAE